MSTNGLQIIDTVPGTGAEAKPGPTVLVPYTGWLYTDGQPGANIAQQHRPQQQPGRLEQLGIPLGDVPWGGVVLGLECHVVDVVSHRAMVR